MAKNIRLYQKFVTKVCGTRQEEGVRSAMERTPYWGEGRMVRITRGKVRTNFTFYYILSARQRYTLCDYEATMLYVIINEAYSIIYPPIFVHQDVVASRSRKKKNIRCSLIY